MSAGEVYYIRIRGVVQGPFSEQQLQSLVQRGDFSRIHEISTDQQKWVRAEEYPQLFYTVVPLPLTAQPPLAPPVIRPQRLENAPASATDLESTLWYYQEQGNQRGPVEVADLTRLRASGQLHDSSPVCRSGTSHWLPLNEVPQLSATQSGRGLAPRRYWPWLLAVGALSSAVAWWWTG